MDRDEFLKMPLGEQDKILNSILADHGTSISHMAENSQSTLKKVLEIIKEDYNRVLDKHGEKAVLAFTTVVLTGLETKSVALRSKYFPSVKKELMERIAKAAREDMARI